MTNKKGEKLKMGLFNKKNKTGENCCTNCGAVLEDDSLFCIECGIAVPVNASSGCDEGKLCPECGETVDDDSNFCCNCGYVFETLLNRCSKCNAILPDDAEVCAMCGTTTGKADPTSTAKTDYVAEPINEPVSVSKITPSEESAPSLRSSTEGTSSGKIKEEELRAAERNFHKPSAL